MKLVWISFGLVILLAGILFWGLEDSDQRFDLQDLAPSPPVRILMARNSPEIELISEVGFDIWIGDSDRPLKWRRRQGKLRIQCNSERFYFAQMESHQQEIRLVPFGGSFEYLGGKYTGSVLLRREVSGNMSVVFHTPLEHYLCKVVQGEMKSSWPLECLKVQAVAARSYALHHMLRRQSEAWDMLGTSAHQAFTPRRPASRCVQAVLETQGYVLMWKGYVVPTYYNSTCGGMTSPVEIAFPGHEPSRPLGGVRCDYCRDSPYFSWQTELNKAEMAEVLAKSFASVNDKKLPAPVDVTKLKTVEIDDLKGRVIYLEIEDEDGRKTRLDAGEFRRQLNRRYDKEVIRSLRFTIAPVADGGWTISGQGWGWHGVGMCQYGARQMAEELWACPEILAYYYPGAKLQGNYGGIWPLAFGSEK